MNDREIFKALMPIIIKASKDQAEANKKEIIVAVGRFTNRRIEDAKQEILSKINVPEILGEIRKENARLKEELFKIQDELFKTAKEVSAQLFNDASFTRKLEKHFDTKIMTNINESLSKKKLISFLRSKINNELKDNLLETVERVVSSVFNKIKKSSEYDLKVTKELCYSMDAEIKHFSMRAGISAETEQIIIEKLDKKLDIAARAFMNDLEIRHKKLLPKKEEEVPS